MQLHIDLVAFRLQHCKWEIFFDFLFLHSIQPFESITTIFSGFFSRIFPINFSRKYRFFSFFMQLNFFQSVRREHLDLLGIFIQIFAKKQIIPVFSFNSTRKTWFFRRFHQSRHRNSEYFSASFNYFHSIRQINLRFFPLFSIQLHLIWFDSSIISTYILNKIIPLIILMLS